MVTLIFLSTSLRAPMSTEHKLTTSHEKLWLMANNEGNIIIRWGGWPRGGRVQFTILALHSELNFRDIPQPGLEAII